MILSKLLLLLLLLRQGQVDGRHREAGVRISSADWFKAGVARQRVGPISLGIAPRACMILSKLLLLLLLLLATASCACLSSYRW